MKASMQSLPKKNKFQSSLIPTKLSSYIYISSYPLKTYLNLKVRNSVRKAMVQNVEQYDQNIMKEAEKRSDFVASKF